MGRSRLWQALAIGTVATLGVASCDPLGDRETAGTDADAPAAHQDDSNGHDGQGGAREDSSGDVSTGRAQEDPAGEPMATLPPEFLECGDPAELDADEGLLLADLDLTGARWSTPPGFTRTHAYHEDNPVEEMLDFWVAEPLDGPVLLNVVVMATYGGLDWGDAADVCGRVPLEAVEERLAGYRDQIGAEALSEAEMTLLAGHPAITQELSLSSYDYVGYWLFTPDQLLHLYCQWTTQREVVEAGCADLVESLQVD